MKTYIKVWVIIALVINLAAGGFLKYKGGDIIRCNKAYNKVFPCYHGEGVGFKGEFLKMLI